jgi:hypothetical protein
MDIAYFVRPGDDNDELRHSMRSLKNIPHGNVYVAGYKPKWLTNVIHIDVPQGANKNLNTTNILECIARDSRVSEDFILMNDDFFIMKQMDEIPRLNRGPIEGVLSYYEPANSGYYIGMKGTHEYMLGLGFKDILSYELHAPMIMNKKNILTMFDKYRADQKNIKPLHKRSLYGNMFNYGGKSIEDVKVYNYDQEFDKNSDFLSTEDGTWQYGEAGRFIRNTFPDKSPYEK